MQTLTFQNITLSPVKQDNQIWLSSSDLAKSLGYSRADKVTQLYNANADEFTPNMTALVDNPKMRNAKIRIFSLRGCHLIAMFARTKVAKEFRKWVLDVLDKEVGQPTIQKTTVDDRTPLRQAVSLLVGKKSLAYDTAYSIVHQYMGVSHIDEIPLDDLPKAISYVHQLIVGNTTINDSIHHLVWHTAHIYHWYKAREEAFYALSPQIVSSVHEHIISAKACANRLHRTLELTFDPDYPRRLV